MGAPGLAFETWDPPRKCRRNQVLSVRENSSSGTSTQGLLAVRVLQLVCPGPCVKDPRSQKRDLGHPSSNPGGSHAARNPAKPREFNATESATGAAKNSELTVKESLPSLPEAMERIKSYLADEGADLESIPSPLRRLRPAVYRTGVGSKACAISADYLSV